MEKFKNKLDLKEGRIYRMYNKNGDYILFLVIGVDSFFQSPTIIKSVTLNTLFMEEFHISKNFLRWDMVKISRVIPEKDLDTIKERILNLADEFSEFYYIYLGEILYFDNVSKEWKPLFEDFVDSFYKSDEYET